jgi:hypothetical protein
MRDGKCNLYMAFPPIPCAEGDLVRMEVELGAAEAFAEGDYNNISTSSIKQTTLHRKARVTDDARTANVGYGNTRRVGCSFG